VSACSARSATDAVAWDAFVQRVTDPDEILQSWAWGEFQSAAGYSIRRLEVVCENSRSAVALLISHRTKIGKSFWLCPRGPLVDPDAPVEVRNDSWKALISAIHRDRPSGTMFAKFEPNTDVPPESPITPGTGTHPETTLLIDLDRSDEALLASMHPKARYNIALAARKGIAVRWANDAPAVEAFLHLLTGTAERQKIGVHPPAYYRTMAATLGPSLEVAIAEYDGRPVAAGIMVRFGDTTTYLHGASDYLHRELMAPYALHWETIRRSRQLGSRYYDFFGIAPEGSVNHRWAGITRFKRGFGGRKKDYPGACNLVFDRNWYMAYRFAKRIAGA